MPTFAVCTVIVPPVRAADLLVTTSPARNAAVARWRSAPCNPIVTASVAGSSVTTVEIQDTTRDRCAAEPQRGSVEAALRSALVNAGESE